jgi:Glycosyl transferase 4-like domain
MKAAIDAHAGMGAATRHPIGQAGRAPMLRVASRPLRICFVTQFGYPVLAGSRTQQIVGGAEVQQALISAELARRGHQVSMISLDFGQTEGERVRGVCMIKTHAMDAGLAGMRFVHPRMTRLWSALQRADADIYYQRSSGAYTGVVGEFARRHGRHMVFASAAATDFDPALPRLKFRRDKWLYRYGLRRASRVVVQSATQLADCKRHFGITPVQIPSCYAHRGTKGRFCGSGTRATISAPIFLSNWPRGCPSTASAWSVGHRWTIGCSTRSPSVRAAWAIWNSPASCPMSTSKRSSMALA